MAVKRRPDTIVIQGLVECDVGAPKLNVRKQRGKQQQQHSGGGGAPILPKRSISLYTGGGKQLASSPSSSPARTLRRSALDRPLPLIPNPLITRAVSLSSGGGAATPREKVKSRFRPAHNPYHHQVCMELVGTEKIYIENLRDGVEMLRKVRQNDNNRTIINKMTTSLEQVKELSIELLKDMCGGKNSQQQDDEEDEIEGISRAFLRHASEMERVYISYCEKHQEIALIVESSENDDDEESSHLGASSTTTTGWLTWELQSMLIKPVQRISKYPLFLENLTTPATAGSSSSTTIRQSLETMREMLSHINTELKRKSPRNPRRRLSLGVAKVAGILKSVGSSTHNNNNSSSSSGPASNTSSLIMSPIEFPIDNIPQLPALPRGDEAQEERHEEEEEEKQQKEKKKRDEIEEKMTKLMDALESYVKDVRSYLHAQSELSTRRRWSSSDDNKLGDLAQHIEMVLFSQVKNHMYIYVIAPLEQGLCITRKGGQQQQKQQPQFLESIYEKCLRNFQIIEHNWHSTLVARIHEMFPPTQDYDLETTAVLNRYYLFINELSD